MRRDKLLNIPNILTALRIIMVPAFVTCFFLLPEKRYISLIIFAAASMTDALDGYLARRLEQITWFGKLFDPLADKLMCIAMLYCLAKDHVIPWWVLGVIFLKEGYMVYGSAVLYRRNVIVKSNMLGKAATALFFLSACLVMPWHTVKAVHDVGIVIMYISLVLSLCAAVNYTRQAVKNQYGAQAR